MAAFQNKSLISLLLFMCVNSNLFAMQQKTIQKHRRHSQEILSRRETHINAELQDVYRHIANSDFLSTKLWIKKNEKLALDYKLTLIDHAKKIVNKPAQDLSSRVYKHLVLNFLAGGTKTVAGFLGMIYGVNKNEPIYISLSALLAWNGTKECLNAFVNRDEFEKNAYAIQALVTNISYKK